MALDFAQVWNYLTDLGVPFTRDSHWVDLPGIRIKQDLPLITQVGPNLHASAWVYLVSSVGDGYIGGCCSQLSYAQDYLCKWLRKDPHHIPVSELKELVGMLAGHEGFDYFKQEPADFDAEIQKALQDELEPLDKFALIWHIIKDHVSLKVPTAVHPTVSELDRSLRILESCSLALGCSRMFQGDTNLSNPRRTDPRRTDRALTLAKIRPALQVVYEHVQELDLGSFEGYALVDLSQGPESICQNGFGYCVYSTLEPLQEISKNWEIYFEPGRYPKIGYRPIRIDSQLEHGYEFTGDVVHL